MNKYLVPIILAISSMANAELESFKILNEVSYSFRWDPYLCAQGAPDAAFKASIEAKSLCEKIGYKNSKLIAVMVEDCVVKTPTVNEVFLGEYICIKE